MTMKIREPKEFDQFHGQNAINLIAEIINEHPEIDGTIWVSAFLFILTKSCYTSKLTYEQYCGEFDKCKEAYKELWNRHEEVDGTT